MAQWSIPLDKLARATGEEMEMVARKAALAVFQFAVQASPVDTGRFKGNWQVTYGAPAASVRDILDKTGAVSGAEVAKVLNLPVGGAVYLANNLPYAQRLEYGWSKQAPAGMVRTALRQFSINVKRVTK